MAPTGVPGHTGWAKFPTGLNARVCTYDLRSYGGELAGGKKSPYLPTVYPIYCRDSKWPPQVSPDTQDGQNSPTGPSARVCTYDLRSYGGEPAGGKKSP